jgi:hypothetical protein
VRHGPHRDACELYDAEQRCTELILLMCSGCRQCSATIGRDDGAMGCPGGGERVDAAGGSMVGWSRLAVGCASRQIRAEQSHAVAIFCAEITFDLLAGC